ncbi:hypothetical protein EWM64_g1011, partial [Hericium alpestre]
SYKEIGSQRTHGMTTIGRPGDKILIVGAGCFGISTAYHLLKRGFTNVTVIDRSEVLPAPDAASTDINKLVRTSYSDSFYSQLAHKAIQAWKNEDMWGDTYRESGILVLGSGGASYADKSYLNDVALGSRITILENTESVRAIFPSDVKTGAFVNGPGYLNLDGGWARAAEGVRRMTSAVVSFGGIVLPGRSAASLVMEEQKVVGIRCSNGEIITGDIVVLATGAWTASTFGNLNVGDKCLATGQSVVTIQLTSAEAERYRQCPAMVDFSSGFYIFPPDDMDVIKMAVHDAGYTHYASGQSESGEHASTPRTILSHGQDGLRIPRTAISKIRRFLHSVYPDLAEKPFASTRLCWYTDSPDGDWIVGSHPSHPGLILATAGSGHAYKFLPVLGELVADAIEGKLEPEVAKKFTIGRQFSSTDDSRINRTTVKNLTVDEFCEPEDLLPLPN